MLDPYLPAVRALVARRVARLGLQPPDREEIVSVAIERLLRTLANEPELKGMPFGAVATTKVADAIIDFLRASRRRVPERLTAPEGFPDIHAPEALLPFEQTVAVGTILRSLRQRERQIVYERHVLELTAGEVASRVDMSVAAVKMTCSRGLRKLRETVARDDVTFAGSPSESGDESRRDIAATQPGDCPSGPRIKVNPILKAASP